MLHLLRNKKGVGLLEVVIAMFLTMVGVMALISLQPTGWKTMAKADYLGRASGILYKTLEEQETLILNPCNTVALVTTTDSVKVSGQNDAISGDMIFTVNTAIAAGADTKSCVVTVTVTWPTNANGISESLAVTRQELNRFGCAAPYVAPIE